MLSLPAYEGCLHIQVVYVCVLVLMHDLIYAFGYFSLYHKLSVLSLCVHVKETYLCGRFDCFCTHTVFEHVQVYECVAYQPYIHTHMQAHADTHTLTHKTEDSAEISSSPQAVKYSVSTAQESQLDSLGGINSKHHNNSLRNQINCLQSAHQLSTNSFPLSLYLHLSLSLFLHPLSCSLCLCLCCHVFSSLSLCLSVCLFLRCVIELLNVLLKLTYCTRLLNIESSFLCGLDLIKAILLFEVNTKLPKHSAMLCCHNYIY